jgi:hypothetical protein
MSAYLLILAEKIWHWILAPPYHWALSLPTEWQIELGGALFVLIFHRRIIEQSVIGREAVADWSAERKYQHEWYHYGGMPEADFHRHVDSLQRRADNEDRLAERLEERGYRGFAASILRQGAVRRRARAEQYRDEAARLTRLRAAVEKETNGPGNKRRMRKKVLDLMHRLDDPLAATNVLAELNRLGNWFDWESLAPDEMPSWQRTRLVQLLRLMAGTTSIGEAVSAYHKARQLLQEGSWEWQWEPA